ncbi:MAG: hypothetical protein R3178_07485, partial [Rhodothermales bacterium]|nr:hypothetical protein [Rhodothermales bacterium]
LLPFFEDREVNLAYAQSNVIDENGIVQGDYALCFPELSSTKWLKSYVNSGQAEFEAGLAIKNTILNASAVVFRKPPLELMEEVLRDFKLSGDWYLYLNILQDARIAYCPDRLNYHRRHGGSIIAKHGDREVAIAEMGRIHSFLLETLEPGDELLERMVAYAFEIWQAENTSAPVSEFWKLYALQVSNERRQNLQEHLLGAGPESRDWVPVSGTIDA